MSERFYAVAVGRQVGVFNTTEDCLAQVSGFSCAQYKRFKTSKEAEDFLDSYSSSAKIVRKTPKAKKEFSGEKYYAVGSGWNTGIFKTCTEMEKSTSGFPFPMARVFNSAEEAKSFIDSKDVKRVRKKVQAVNKGFPRTNSQKTTAIAYVDGSYSEKSGMCGHGVILLHNNKTAEFVGYQSGESALKIKNVAGELDAAMTAVSEALKLSPVPKRIVIYHDFSGTEVLANENIKATSQYVQIYKNFIEDHKDKIKIEFKKVPAHSGVLMNCRADKLARKAIGLR